MRFPPNPKSLRRRSSFVISQRVAQLEERLFRVQEAVRADLTTLTVRFVTPVEAVGIDRRGPNAKGPVRLRGREPFTDTIIAVVSETGRTHKPATAGATPAAATVAHVAPTGRGSGLSYRSVQVRILSCAPLSRSRMRSPTQVVAAALEAVR